LGREIAPGKITFPSSEEINPRLRDLFSSRLVMVDAIQSPGLAIEPGGAGGAGAGGGASGALPFGRFEEDLAVAPPLVELAAAVRFFFFTITKSGEDLEGSGGGAAIVKVGRRRRASRRYAKSREDQRISLFGDFKRGKNRGLCGHVSLLQAL
jgi:hypothetical protein